MLKIIFLIFGAIFTVVGFLIFILPIPFGLPIFAIGLSLLVMGSDTIARWIKRRRATHTDLNETLNDIQEKVPNIICEPLEKTTPDTDQK